MKAIIIAGGYATRMKGKTPPKCLLHCGPGKTTLLQRLLDQIEGMGIEETTLMMGRSCIGAVENTAEAHRVEMLEDPQMQGPIVALSMLTRAFFSEEVLITTGDAFFEDLSQLKRVDYGHVKALVDPRASSVCIKIRQNPDGTIAVDKNRSSGGFCYAGALAVHHCSMFWQGVAFCAGDKDRFSHRPLAYCPPNAVELVEIDGFWKNVNTREDLKEVEEWIYKRGIA